MQVPDHGDESSSDSSAGEHLRGAGSYEFQRKRRKRTTAAQLALLETHFANDMLPSNETRAALADRLGMSPRRVQIWFQNKRAKNKRIQREAQRRSEEDHASSSDGQRSKVICVETTQGVPARRASLPEHLLTSASAPLPAPSSPPSVVVPQAQPARWPRALPSLAELHLSAETRSGYTNALSVPIKLPPLRNLVDLPEVNMGNAITPFSRPSFFPASA